MAVCVSSALHLTSTLSLVTTHEPEKLAASKLSTWSSLCTGGCMST